MSQGMVMPKFYEIYGQDPTTYVRENNVSYAKCPFIDSECDGGGNRHQTKVRIDSGSPLRSFYSETINKIIPAVCSIEYGNGNSEENWVVCPRRLLGFKNDTQSKPLVNNALKEHEKQALRAVGLVPGIEYGVWPEVYLQYKDDGVSINYHFDFVIAPFLQNMSLLDVATALSIDSTEEYSELKKCANTGKYISGKNGDTVKLSVFPDISSPIIIEIMTASTSGSNEENETSIPLAFRNCLCGTDYTGPGINKRQVWGRMATQLFAKTALTSTWGGKTVWLVQDQLLKDICLTTKLKIVDGSVSSDDFITFLSMGYKAGEKGINSLKVAGKYEIKAGLDFNGNGACTDILLPKEAPGKQVLLKSMLRRELAAIVKI